MILNDGYVFVMFDLPINTKEEKFQYTKFRKNLIKNGYVMFQQSIYQKYIRELKSIDYERHFIVDISPKNGNIRLFKMTKKQFESIEIICGDKLDTQISDNYVEY